MKTICPENKIDLVIPTPAKVIADVVGVSESTVKKIDAGTRSADTETGKKVKFARELMASGQSTLIQAVKKVIKEL